MFFPQNGAHGWCENCADLVLVCLKMVLMAGAKFVLMWCFCAKMVFMLLQNLVERYADDFPAWFLALVLHHENEEVCWAGC